MSDRVNYTNGKDMPIDALKNSFIFVRINENLSFIYGRIHKMDKDIEEEKTRIYYGAIIPVSKGKLMGDWVKDDGYVVIDFDTTVAWAKQEYLDNLVELG